MGWWQVEGTVNLVGDEPLDTLRDAVAEIVAQYQAAHDRVPTKAEWRALLSAVFDEDDPAYFPGGVLPS